MMTKESGGRKMAVSSLAKTTKKKRYCSGAFIVRNDKGLHTRPSTELVKCATLYKSEINLIHQGILVNAKSLLAILTLAASRGSRVVVEAHGEDAQEAVDAILELAQNKFFIHY